MVVPHHITAGEVFEGRYRIERELGRGAMGVVYEGTQLSVGRRVAIKTLHAARTVEEIHRKRFVREARIISQLEHPNTIRILDFGTTQSDHLYYVMEYLKGESLMEALKKRLFNVADTIHVARQLGKALAEAHARGIVHRDLKPGNIFLKTVYGEPLFTKLLDFGIARDYENAASESLTQAGLVVGTVRYMAPEQSRAEPLDGRADLYSLGCVMTEMLVGLARPDTELSIISQLRRIAEGVAPEPFTLESTDPRKDELIALILQCRDPNPSQRPADAEAFVDKLNSLGQKKRESFIPEPTIMMPATGGPNADETVLFDRGAGGENAPQPPTNHERPSTPVPPPTAVNSPADYQRQRTVPTTPKDRRLAPRDDTSQIIRSRETSSPRHRSSSGTAANNTSLARPILIGVVVLALVFGAFLAQRVMNPQPDVAPEGNTAQNVGHNGPKAQPATTQTPQKAPQRAASTSKHRSANAPTVKARAVRRAPQKATARVKPRRLPILEPRWRTGRLQRRGKRALATSVAPYQISRTVQVTPEAATIRQDGRIIGTGSATIEWASNTEPPTLKFAARGYRSKTLKLDPLGPNTLDIALKRASKPTKNRDFYPLPQ